MEYSLSEIRREYARRSLSEKDVKDNPIYQFRQWLEEAIKSQVPDPSAMILSTANKQNRVSSRVVLLKEIQEEGFVFYTNYNSKKASDLKENEQAGLLFFWSELERQIRIEGYVEFLSTEISDKYFASRPEESKIGAWASDQSKIIPSRQYLEERVKKFEDEFKGQEIIRPEHWGGYILKPYTVEFWQGRPNRLHDRIQFTFKANQWIIRRLAP
ncbi:MAG: pyridoxamine 5'-phosphate oxidase [Bacteroidota bacterium]